MVYSNSASIGTYVLIIHKSVLHSSIPVTPARLATFLFTYDERQDQGVKDRCQRRLKVYAHVARAYKVVCGMCFGNAALRGVVDELLYAEHPVRCLIGYTP